jgi:hypothetical protein
MGDQMEIEIFRITKSILLDGEKGEFNIKDDKG